MKKYPSLMTNTVPEILKFLMEISRFRNEDIQDYDNLSSNFNQGFSKNTGEVTLTAGAASTVVNHMSARPESFISFAPLTANAAAELAAGTMYVADADRGTKTFTITHANAVSVDRTFSFVIIGGV